MPPNTSGIIPEAYVASAAQTGDAIRRSFGAASSVGRTTSAVSGPCDALTVVVKATGEKFDAVMIREDLQNGQVVLGYSLELEDCTTGQWAPVRLNSTLAGQTVGMKSIARLPALASSNACALRFKCTRAIGGPKAVVRLLGISLHMIRPPPDDTAPPADNPADATGALIFRDDFSSINASCGDCPACHTSGGCRANCTACPWELSLTGAAPSHSSRAIIPCPAGRAGTCIHFGVTYCGGSGKRGPCYRSELSGRAGLGERPGFAYGQDYWFGFSFRLPDGFSLGTQNPQDQIHFQMHGSRNRGEAYRDPVFEIRARPTHPPGTAAWWVSSRGDPRENMTAGARGCR